MKTAISIAIPTVAAVFGSAPRASAAAATACEVIVVLVRPETICMISVEAVSSPCVPSVPPAIFIIVVGSGVRKSTPAPTSSIALPPEIKQDPNRAFGSVGDTQAGGVDVVNTKEVVKHAKRCMCGDLLKMKLLCSHAECVGT